MSARHRRPALLLGVLALAGGLLALRGETWAALVPATVSGLTIVGIGLVVWMAHRLVFRSGTTGVETPAVERTRQWAPPGADIDRTLAEFDGQGEGYLPAKYRLHDRLRKLVRTALAHRWGCRPEAARRRIEEGDWPEDPILARFLTDADASRPSSWPALLRGALYRGWQASDFQVLFGATVDELAARVRGARVEASRIVADSTSEYDGPLVSFDTGPDPGPADDAATVPTGRWETTVWWGVLVLGAGLASHRSSVVLAGGAVLALGFLGTQQGTGRPHHALEVHRTIDAITPEPGASVTVTTTVTNSGSSLIPDLRLVDGVPAGLPVIDGSPRLGTTLRPGESSQMRYTVEARRGPHAFAPPAVRIRSVFGAHCRMERPTPTTDSDERLTCRPTVDARVATAPVTDQHDDSRGRVPGDAGDGAEFYGTREYQRGDPPTRVDWRRVARSPADELTTVQYRADRGATVALVLDVRSGAYVAPNPDDPSALERCVEAAAEFVASSIAAGDRVGLAALGPRPLWIQPGAGAGHQERLLSALGAHPALAPTPPESGHVPAKWVDGFHRRFPPGTQVLYCTPLCDRLDRHVIRQLEAYGHDVTVLTPDPTADATVGQRFCRLERTARIASIRRSDVRVIEWPWEERLEVALAGAGRSR